MINFRHIGEKSIKTVINFRHIGEKSIRLPGNPAGVVFMEAGPWRGEE